MKYFFILLFLLLSSFSFSQQLYPLSRDMIQVVDNAMFNTPDFHSENKPYVNNLYTFTYLQHANRDSAILSKIHSKFLLFIWKKVRTENLIKAKNDDFSINIDPLFNFNYGKFNTLDKSIKYSSTYENTRGAIIQGTIGKNVSFFSTLYENQARFIDYVNANILQSGVIPGDGTWKEFKGNPNNFDYSSVSGMVSWTPSKHLNLQFGHSKNFIGDGYRSLLLSDNSFNYPFLKTKFNFGKFEYTNIYASFQIAKYTYNYAANAVYQKKFATMHLLSYCFKKNFTIALFESTMWQAKAGNLVIPYKAGYLNPVIGIQTMAFGLNQSNNNILGLNLKYQFIKHHILYSQIVLDDISFNGNKSNNRYGIQLGYKYFNVFNIKNLFFQTEFNAVKPFTYSHKDSIQSFTHYNQALAHPLGANLIESVSFLNYRYKDFLIELKLNYAIFGLDTGKFDFGQNIFRSFNPDKSSESKISQGLKNTLSYMTFRLYFLVNPVTNMNLFFEVSDRRLKSDALNYHSDFITFGLKTNLNNYYYDF